MAKPRKSISNLIMSERLDDKIEQRDREDFQQDVYKPVKDTKKELFDLMEETIETEHEKKEKKPLSSAITNIAVVVLVTVTIAFLIGGYFFLRSVI